MAMIETTNLCKRYGDFLAINNLNLSIESGECFGFIGPNGAGKTTTIKILSTLLKPTSGQAMVDGKIVGRQNRQIRPVIGYVPDFMGAYDDILVAEYLEFFAACYEIHGTKRKRIVAEALELTDLTHKASDYVNALSRGMQQRLSIARVLLHDPKVLLLDEPASGLDPRARVEVRELLLELKRMGKTILISSHILSELAELCTTIGVVERGELLYHGSVKEAIRRAQVGTNLHIAVDARIEAAADLLRTASGVESVAIVDGELHVAFAPSTQASVSDLPNRLINAGFRLTKFAEESVDLEAAFLHLTKGLVQ